MKQRVKDAAKKSLNFYDRLASFEDAATVIAAMLKQGKFIAVINGRIFAQTKTNKSARESSVFLKPPESWRRSRRS